MIGLGKWSVNGLVVFKNHPQSQRTSNISINPRKIMPWGITWTTKCWAIAGAIGWEEWVDGPGLDMDGLNWWFIPIANW